MYTQQPEFAFHRHKKKLHHEQHTHTRYSQLFFTRTKHRFFYQNSWEKRTNASSTRCYTNLCKNVTNIFNVSLKIDFQ